MGTYMKTDFYTQQIMENLGDVLFSSKRVFDHLKEKCSDFKLSVGGCLFSTIFI